jgi:hypothetical protein
MADNCYAKWKEVMARKDVEEILYSEAVVPIPTNPAVAEEVFSSICSLRHRHSDSLLYSAIPATAPPSATQAPAEELLNNKSSPDKSLPHTVP